MLEAREKILAYFAEMRELDAAIAACARDASAEHVLGELEHRRNQIEQQGWDHLLDYYCASERAAGRDPYGAKEAEVCHAA